MARVKVYLRVAKMNDKFHIKASMEPHSKLIGNKPTVAFAVIFDIPDEKFREAEKIIAEIPVRDDSVEIVTEVAQPNENPN